MSTLSKTYEEGIVDALLRYGVKEAGVLQSVGNAAAGMGRSVGTAASGMGRFLVGHPEKLLQGRKAFQPGGAFDPKNVFWPTINNSKGQYSPIQTWASRGLGTILPAYGALRALKGQDGDPNEGRLTNALSGIGGAIGSGYGFSMGGMIGAPFIQQAGSAIGKNVGRMLGSRPMPQAPPEPTPEQIQRWMQSQQPLQGGY